MRSFLLTASVAISIAAGFLNFSYAQDREDKKMQNPFFESWTANTYNVPPFSQIKEEHYLSAVEQAIKEQRAEIEAIIGNREEATFENTILALDNSGMALEKVLSVFYNVYQANATPFLRGIMPTVSQMVTAHSDEVYMNPFLFRRVKRLKSNVEKLQLEPKKERLLNKTYKNFVLKGAELDEDKGKRLKEINTRIAELENTFSQNVLDATQAVAVIINNESELDGLPSDYKQAAKERAIQNGNKGWQFGLDNPSFAPFLQYVNNGSLREQLLKEYLHRCHADPKERNNIPVLSEIVKLRLEKAKLLGFVDYASYELANDRMATNTKAVYALLDKIWAPGLAKAKEELSQMKAIQVAELSTSEPFKASDWRYYSDKLRREKYDLDENEIRPYFSLNAVRDGIFDLCNTLYGINFKQIEDVQIPTPNTTAYICSDKDGSVLGLIYMDMVARPGFKSNGAWNTNYVSQRMEDGKRITPITSIVANFSEPTGDKPTLLNIDETETFFHEFGHALHNLFANVLYRGLAEVPRDFVELPSQIMEHWSMAPEMLKKYAKHYKTGEVMPDSLIAKITKAGKYGQGFATTEFVAAAYLDMDYHILSSVKSNIDVDKFEKKQLNKKRGLIEEIAPRYRSTYFLHSMGGGYTAGYYSYLWAEVLDCDAFEAFTETNNIFNSEIAEAFRKKILENGGMYDAMQMYRDFRGKEAGVDPLLRNRGLIAK